ncbi:RNA recognition motif domain-containing protein [Ditylenchus destructor]|nr:RNA recognition motif domain-containing protein [Ditylenchus destructor]
MLSLFRPARIYFHQIFNTRRQLCAFTLTIPIQSNVNHEVTRKLSTSKPLSIEIYSAHSKKKLLSAANRRHLISQFYTLQSFFSSSSGSRKFDESRTLMVAGLSRDTTEVALCVCFSKKWEVTKCSIVRDKKTGNSRKFGFVEFLTAEQAKHALEFDHFIDRKQVSVIICGNKELHDKYRIFVGGLLTETSGATLHKHFSQFGDIFDCSIVRKENNLSRGFGYVTYKSQESVDRALNSQPHSIDNKEVYVNQAYSRQRELTLFIGNLSPKTTDESLREHFSKYGQLTECEVKTDRQTGQSRGFGYVAFASQEELNRALNEQTHMIDDVEVKLGNRSSELDLMVNSLPRNIGEESLKKLLLDLFSGYGQVRDCRLIKNSAGGITAFVSMSSRDEVDRVMERQYEIPYSINAGTNQGNIIICSLLATWIGIKKFVQPPSLTHKGTVICRVLAAIRPKGTKDPNDSRLLSHIAAKKRRKLKEMTIGLFQKIRPILPVHWHAL